MRVKDSTIGGFRYALTHNIARHLLHAADFQMALALKISVCVLNSPGNLITSLISRTQHL